MALAGAEEEANIELKKVLWSSGCPKYRQEQSHGFGKSKTLPAYLSWKTVSKNTFWTSSWVEIVSEASQLQNSLITSSME
jgi:hypothetical protein